MYFLNSIANQSVVEFLSRFKSNVTVSDSAAGIRFGTCSKYTCVFTIIFVELNFKMLTCNITSSFK